MRKLTWTIPRRRNSRKGITIPSSASVWPRERRLVLVDIIQFSIPSRGGRRGRGERLVLHGGGDAQRENAPVADEGPQQRRKQLPAMRDRSEEQTSELQST